MYEDIKSLMKDMRNIAEGANDHQLLSLMLELQTNIYDLQDENRDLRLKNEEMQRNIHLNNNLEKKDNHYYLGEKGPYCTNCWDKDNKLIYVLDTPKSMMRLGNYRCPNCEAIAN